MLTRSAFLKEKATTENTPQRLIFFRSDMEERLQRSLVTCLQETDTEPPTARTKSAVSADTGVRAAASEPGRLGDPCSPPTPNPAARGSVALLGFVRNCASARVPGWHPSSVLLQRISA